MYKCDYVVLCYFLYIYSRMTEAWRSLTFSKQHTHQPTGTSIFSIFFFCVAEVFVGVRNNVRRSISTPLAIVMLGRRIERTKNCSHNKQKIKKKNENVMPGPSHTITHPTIHQSPYLMLHELKSMHSAAALDKKKKKNSLCAKALENGSAFVIWAEHTCGTRRVESRINRWHGIVNASVTLATYASNHNGHIMCNDFAASNKVLASYTRYF